MAIVVLSQNVANSPTNSYPVGIFKVDSGQGTGAELQAIVLVDSEGEEYDALNPLPIAGSFSASLATAATASEDVVTVDNTAGGTAILAANGSRKDGSVRVSIKSTQGVYIARAATADADSRYFGPGDIIPLASGACIYTGPITAFVPTGSALVEFTEL